MRDDMLHHESYSDLRLRMSERKCKSCKSQLASVHPNHTKPSERKQTKI